jgi:hypothetical protein
MVGRNKGANKGSDLILSDSLKNANKKAPAAAGAYGLFFIFAP